MMGAERPLVLSPEERRVTAYHEGGHALVALLVPGADPVHKVTIVPRGQALGATQIVPIDDRHNYPRTYLLARLAVGLGGRVAEELETGEITTGAENDLKESPLAFLAGAAAARCFQAEWSTHSACREGKRG